jgi:subtilisin family serine protease
MKKKIACITLSAALVISSFSVGVLTQAEASISDSETLSIFAMGNRGMSGVVQDGSVNVTYPTVTNPNTISPIENIQPIEPIDQIQVGEDFILEDVETVDEIDANDPGVQAQWYLTSTNSYLLWDEIEAVQDETVYVAVLDTGVDYEHEDLINRVDESLGYDFVNDDSDPMDDHGHGTHVSGIIAAEMDNETGIVGIVGDLDVVIIPIKVLDEEGTGEPEDIIAGIEYAIEQGADIINISFGGETADSEGIVAAIEEAIAADIIVVAASGNDSSSCDMYIPASIDGVYTVAASSMDNSFADFSNYGSSVEIVAPGEKILSTVLNDSYEAWDGTSMSTPIVTGIAAMLKAYDENLTAEEIMEYLNESANAYTGYPYSQYTGYGLIDAAGAYEALTGEDIYDEDSYEDGLIPTETTNNNYGSGNSSNEMPGTITMPGQETNIIPVVNTPRNLTRR